MEGDLPRPLPESGGGCADFSDSIESIFEVTSSLLDVHRKSLAAMSVQTGSQISEENRSLYKNIVTVSFMIFRTGSILIVGMCDENVLYSIYEFLKVLLVAEFYKIGQKIITPEIHETLLESIVIAETLLEPIIEPLPETTENLS